MKILLLASVGVWFVLGTLAAIEPTTVDEFFDTPQSYRPLETPAERDSLLDILLSKI